MYLHGGFVHCLCNMIALLVLGLPLERTHGSIRLGLIYMVSGIFGFVMCAALSPHTITVGASGAIFGLIGAGLAEVILNWNVYPNPCRLLLQLALGAFVQLLIGTMPILDNFTHFFGCCMGFFCALVLLLLQRETSSGRRLQAKWYQRAIQI